MAKRLNRWPITLRAANRFVLRRHRHHGPVAGHKFAIAARIGKKICGVVIVGRPVARSEDKKRTIAEVTRLCCDGTPNVCSYLYAAAARACAAMGYTKIRTSILASETGHSLLASGWRFSHVTRATDWNRPKRARKVVPHLKVPKKVFVKELTHAK
jgi:hypothetical protein